MRTTIATGRLRTPRGGWLLFLVLVSVGGHAAFASGLFPWIAPFAATLGLTLAVGQRVSWSVAFSTSVVLQLAAAAVLFRLTPMVGWSLTAGAVALFVVASASGIIVLARTVEVRLPRPTQALGAGIALTVLSAAVAFVVLRAAPGADYEWAMHNDAVWNVVTTRFMITDGGLDVATHPNSSPLTAMAMATAADVGRAGLPVSELFSHDVSRFGTFWLLAGALSCSVAGLVGYRAAAASKPLVRCAAASVAAVIPSTWFVYGVATGFGFYNATIAVIILCASWMLWLGSRESALVTVLALNAAAVALLATWAPLAILPFTLMLAVFWQTGRGGGPGQRATPGERVRLVLAATIPVPLYAATVTLPDLGRDGAALSVEGAFIPFLPVHILTIAIVAVTVVCLVALCTGEGHEARGLFIVLAAATPALAYLLYQRRDAISLWGYYPAKFAWFVSILLLVITATTLMRISPSLGFRRLSAPSSLALALMLPLSLMAHIPPPDGWRTAITPVSIAFGWGSAAPSDRAHVLFGVAEAGVPTLTLHYADAATDQFANAWLLQLESQRSSDPIRNFSYFLKPGDEEHACEAIMVWDREVRVVTSDEGLEQRLRRTCTAGAFRVELRPNPLGDSSP